jgi:hypothetical protein
VLRHVAVFRWKTGTTGEQVDAIVAALATLPGEIPEIRAYHFGPDAGLVPANFDFCVVADLDDEAAWAVYRDNPVHRRIIEELISPFVDTRVAVQYVIDQTA